MPPVFAAGARDGSAGPGHAFYDQASSGQAHLVPAEQQQELRHQQDYHE